MTFLAIVGALAVVGAPLLLLLDQLRCERMWRRALEEPDDARKDRR